MNGCQFEGWYTQPIQKIHILHIVWRGKKDDVLIMAIPHYLFVTVRGHFQLSKHIDLGFIGVGCLELVFCFWCIFRNHTLSLECLELDTVRSTVLCLADQLFC